MSILQNIQAALLTAYQAMGLNLPTAYEGRDFNPPASASWARVVNFPADKYVASLGSAGEDIVTGFFQIDFFVPENDGTKRLNDYASAALEKYKNGARFSYGGQEVQIRRSSLSQIRRDPDRANLKITLSFYWDSRTSR